MQFKEGEFAILWKARCMFLFGKYFGKCNRPFSGWDPGYRLSGSQHQIGIARWVKILGVKRACLLKSVPLTIGIQWFLRREVVPLKKLYILIQEGALRRWIDSPIFKDREIQSYLSEVLLLRHTKIRQASEIYYIVFVLK